MDKEQVKDKAKWEKVKTANVLGLIIVLMCGGYLTALLFIEVPDKNRDIVNFLGGSFFTLLGGIGLYFFNYKGKNGEDINEFSDQDQFGGCKFNSDEPTKH